MVNFTFFNVLLFSVNESDGNINYTDENGGNVPEDVVGTSVPGETDLYMQTNDVNVNVNCFQFVVDNPFDQTDIGYNNDDIQETTHLEENANQHVDLHEEIPAQVPEIPSNVQQGANPTCQNEDSDLIARARAAGVIYEYAKPGSTESTDDQRRRRRRNQRRILQGERRAA